jgi:hypothetical protein
MRYSEEYCDEKSALIRDSFGAELKFSSIKSATIFVMTLQYTFGTQHPDINLGHDS